MLATICQTWFWAPKYYKPLSAIREQGIDYSRPRLEDLRHGPECKQEQLQTATPYKQDTKQPNRTTPSITYMPQLQLQYRSTTISTGKGNLEHDKTKTNLEIIQYLDWCLHWEPTQLLLTNGSNESDFTCCCRRSSGKFLCATGFSLKERVVKEEIQSDSYHRVHLVRHKNVVVTQTLTRELHRDDLICYTKLFDACASSLITCW
jgi:hypothetical protein